jgi:membrane-bound lytic murein transglycosylase D
MLQRRIPAQQLLMRKCFFSRPLPAVSLLALALAGAHAPWAFAATSAALPTSLIDPAAQSSQAQLSPHQQAVRQIIQQVEDAYALGQAAYKKGQLAEAKSQFDRAVDLLLTSSIPVKSDTQLQDEFIHIVDGVNALEMEALKQGNGFAPAEEETPADVASDITFEADPTVVAKARTELATTKSDLPLVVNDFVGTFIKFFSQTQKGHNTLLHSIQRSGRYKAMIQRILAEEGVPQDLIYLAVAESGFQPRAQNRRSRAGGMWQFMPNDKFYGLARTNYVDERFDPEKSTRAYARYMKFIYDQLGDWYLSMAAYDWGTGSVQHAVQKTGYADYWELYKRNNLPGETKNYVPEILAAIIIANNPTQYGFDDVTYDPPVLTDTVTINYSIDLRLISDIVNAPVDELTALNPSLLRMVTPPDASFDLHLPAGTATLFEQRVALVPETKRNAWRYHRLTADDTLASVAREFHVSESELGSVNQLHDGASLQGLDALVIPQAPPSAPATRMVLYTARRGDTLVTISDRFGISLTDLRRWNHLTGASVKVAPGSRLHVAEPAAPTVTSHSRHHGASASRSQATHTASSRSAQPSAGKPPARKSKSHSSSTAR